MPLSERDETLGSVTQDSPLPHELWEKDPLTVEPAPLEEPPSRQTYTYSGDGIRLSAATGAQANKTTQFVVDRAFPLPTVVIERDGSGKLLRRYVYGLDLLSQTTPTKGPYWYHHDGLGSVSDITSSSGTSLSWAEYQPYGLLRASGSTSQAPINPFGFTGQYLDIPTGLYHLRARQYDPGLGRFLSVDQLAPPRAEPAVGTYVYVANDPINRVDPAGLWTGGVCVTGGIGIGPFSFGFDLCVALSSSGQAGVTGTVQAGGGVNLDAYAGVGGQVSSGNDLSDLSGPFAAVGGSGVLGVGVQGSVFGGAGHCGQSVNGAQGAVIVGGGASGFGAAQTTGVMKVVGPEDQACSVPVGVVSK